MANPEHLAKLQEGVEAWNAWRFENHHIRPHLHLADLSGADLSGAYLSESNLSGTDLSRVDLCETVLDRANLSGAKLNSGKLQLVSLSSANLNGADLSEAVLDRVDLSGADLSGANLTMASLWGISFNWSLLTSANFSKACISNIVFSNTDLSTVKGLDTCTHYAESSIDYYTLEKSGDLPLAFLRGCGLPDVFIDYLPSLLNQPIQYYSCFISYSSQDEEFAKRLYADLQNHGVRCWYAPEDMKIGDKIRTRIDEVIRLHEKLLIVLSEQSVASDWVEKEVETAFEKERKHKEPVLFPIRLDGTVMDCETGWAADIKRTRHIGDFRQWKDHDAYQESFERLLRDLKVEQDVEG